MSFELKDEFCEPCKFITLTSVKAELFCDDCRERYCEKCALDHAKFRVLRNHQIYSLLPQTSCDESDYLMPVNTRSMKECSKDNTHQQVDAYRQELYDRGDKSGTRTVGTKRDKYVYGTTDQHRAAGKGQAEVKNTSVGNINTHTKDGNYINVELNNGSNITGTCHFGKQADKHVLHERKDVIEASGPKTDIVAACLDVVEQKETETPESVPPCFDVKVLYTDLASRIKGVTKDNILRFVFKLSLEKSCFSLSFGKKTVFKCAYHSVRRYGIKGDTISIEIGRQCEIGPGFLKVTTGQSKEVFGLIITF